MVSYEKRKEAVDRAIAISKAVESGDDPILHGLISYRSELTWDERINNWLHRMYNTYIRPIWWKLEKWDQTRVRGYARCEVWNFYSYHAQWVLPRLIELRDNFHSMPLKNEDTIDIDGVPDNYTPEEWKEILNKMCRAFWLVKKKDEDFITECDPLTYELIQEGLELFAKHYLSLWD